MQNEVFRRWLSSVSELTEGQQDELCATLQRQSKKMFSEKTWIYRYIPFRRFVEILVNKKNILVSPSKWQDPFEGLSLSNHPTNVFAQCWTLESKSDAMWQVYSKGIDGVRIRTTVGKLKESLKNKNGMKYKICKVRYVEMNKLERSQIHIDDQPYQNFEKVDAYLLKHVAFEYEREVRLICCTAEEQKGIGLYNYCIRPTDVIEQVMIHPQATDSELKMLEKILKVTCSEEIKIDTSIRYKRKPN